MSLTTGSVSSTEQQFAANFDITELLNKIHEFCSFQFNDNNRGKEMQSNDIYNYLVNIIPQLCKKLSENLSKEESLVEVKNQCFIFGDIHGNLEDLWRYSQWFWSSNNFPEANYVFLGDYVDRGQYSILCATYLMALKYSEPNRFTLIRGNHEVREINAKYTFHKECTKKFGRKTGHNIWQMINKCFESFPLAAVIDREIFCCHGGVPQSNALIQQIKEIPKGLVETDDKPMAHQILWNDPIESMTSYNENTEQSLREKGREFRFNKSRGTGYYFTAQAVKNFLEINSLKYVIRAHEVVNEGFRFTSNNRVITVFSSSDYCGDHNRSACIEVTQHYIQPIILKTPNNYSED